ncbi:MAG: helix-turn-helix transcriptional regulator [Agathobacter sp.]|nr:helix-turn-helix transcriptional regulator [Agathobacter sp.]
MKEEQKILIDRINELCKERGLSYYTLSYKSGVPLSTLMHIMDGTVKNPGIYTIVRLCAGMRMTLSEFFDTEEFKVLSETANMEE